MAAATDTLMPDANDALPAVRQRELRAGHMPRCATPLTLTRAVRRTTRFVPSITAGDDHAQRRRRQRHAHGNGGNDTLDGGAGNDTLNGGNGDDILDGQAGADIMAGGAGNDTYFVDNAADQVFEAVGGGTDTVCASVNYALQAGQEVEFLRANAGATGLMLTGNEFERHCWHAGNDTLNGGDGNDTLNGGDGNDTLAGGDGNDTLNGGNGNDVLNGQAGADIMAGGAGNDTYYVDNAADQVFEAVGGGTDTVFASVNYALQAGQEVETLRAYAGATGLILTGNEFNNAIVGLTGNDTLNGGDGNDTLNGGDGNDTLDGGDGNDTLNGGNGNDVLNGQAGADLMAGGAGNDTYYVDNAADQVFEAVGGGTDTVFAQRQLRAAGGSGSGDSARQRRRDWADPRPATSSTIPLSVLPATTRSTAATATTRSMAVTATTRSTAAMATTRSTAGMATTSSTARPGPISWRAVPATTPTTSTMPPIRCLRRWAAAPTRFLLSVNYALQAGQEVEISARQRRRDRADPHRQRVQQYRLSGLTGDDTLNGGDGNDTLNGGDGNDALARRRRQRHAQRREWQRRPQRPGRGRSHGGRCRQRHLLRRQCRRSGD